MIFCYILVAIISGVSQSQTGILSVVLLSVFIVKICLSHIKYKYFFVTFVLLKFSKVTHIFHRSLTSKFHIIIFSSPRSQDHHVGFKDFQNCLVPQSHICCKYLWTRNQYVLLWLTFLSYFPFYWNFLTATLIIIKFCAIYINFSFYITEMLIIVCPPLYQMNKLVCMKGIQGNCFDKHKDSVTFFKKTCFGLKVTNFEN